MFEKSLNSKSYKIILISLSVLVVLSLIVALVPSWREKIQSLMWTSNRVILAKSQGDLEPGGPPITVIKVKTPEGLFVEIYKGGTESESLELLGQFPLDGTQDGFFNFQNQAANLVLTDVDNDGYLDVMAPTFDDRQQARMNIFRYNTEVEVFEKYQPHE